MSNSVDPDETAHYEPSHLDLRCLQKTIIIAYGSERVKKAMYITVQISHAVSDQGLHYLLKFCKILSLLKFKSSVKRPT